MADPAGWNPDQPGFDPNVWAAKNGIEISDRGAGLVPVGKNGQPLSDRPAGGGAAPASTPIPALKPATQDYGIRLSNAPGNQLTRGGALDPLSTIEQYESKGRNVPNYRYDPTHTAQGYWQITNSTWRDVAPRAGVDLSQYPTAMSAPRDIQRAVAGRLFGERGYQPWAPYNPALADAVGYKTGLHVPSGALGGNLDLAGLAAQPMAQNQLAALPPASQPTAPAQPLANPLAMMALLAAGTHTFVPVKYDPFVGVTPPGPVLPVKAASPMPAVSVDTAPVPTYIAKTGIRQTVQQFNQGLSA